MRRSGGAGLGFWTGGMWRCRMLYCCCSVGKSYLLMWACWQLEVFKLSSLLSQRPTGRGHPNKKNQLRRTLRFPLALSDAT